MGETLFRSCAKPVSVHVTLNAHFYSFLLGNTTKIYEIS